MSTVKLEVGKVYRLIHSRKGEFAVAVDHNDGVWVTGYIVDGATTALLPENRLVKGERVQMRLTLIVDADELPTGSSNATF